MIIVMLLLPWAGFLTGFFLWRGRALRYEAALRKICALRFANVHRIAYDDAEQIASKALAREGRFVYAPPFGHPDHRQIAQEIVTAHNGAEAQRATVRDLFDALCQALDREPSPCRCMPEATPPHVCYAHKALEAAHALGLGGRFAIPPVPPIQEVWSIRPRR